MPDDVNLAKAELKELDEKFKEPKNSDKWVTVQFNPDTLKVTYANQIQQPNGSGDQRGPQTQQFVGAGSMKLAVQLYFDVTQALPDKDAAIVDVRKLTQRVAYYITPAPDANDATKFIPPAIRFVWGSFQFDGIMESMEETLEYFAPDGRPLRASLAIVLTQQKITTFALKDAEAPSFTRKKRAPVGTTPQLEAPANSSVQSLAGDGGGNSDWQTMAAANGIENPRLLEPGQLIDPSLRKPQIALD
jgi:hypothetical protein